jgi:ElaB/YqjD/DUF883 family membrane-anchored ribosome-binding protein
LSPFFFVQSASFSAHAIERRALHDGYSLIRSKPMGLSLKGESVNDNYRSAPSMSQIANSQSGADDPASTGAVARGVSNIRDDLEVLAADAKDTAMASIVEVKSVAARAVSAAKDKGAHAVKAASSTIAENPVKSLGIAFGVGVVLGMVLLRPRD